MAWLNVSKRRKIAANNMDKKINMTELDHYLAEYYVNTDQLSALCEISAEELHALIQAQLIPEASYVVTASGTIHSFVFGEMQAPGAMPGHYFHRANIIWAKRARTAIAQSGQDSAQAMLRQDFMENFCTALTELNVTTWRLTDSFNEDGTAIEDGLRARAESTWKYFLNGTFGLCVAHPVSEAAIANKEVLQEKLSALTENGRKLAWTQQQLAPIWELIDAYADASMPFSPIEYSISSRKRLVDDLKARLST